ncbi:MAG: hypothetical protein KJ706_01300 [Candidatus Omnitrophica bacterium]|nr:hypothetical protein [Candidatus Omnitrophota bacterium]
MYYNLNWWAGISNFWIEPILRGKGIADIWLNNYIKPYLLKNGFELAGPEGRCFELREYTNFWKKQGFPATFSLNQLYYDPEEIIFYVSVKRLKGQSQPDQTLASMGTAGSEDIYGNEAFRCENTFSDEFYWTEMEAVQGSKYLSEETRAFLVSKIEGSRQRLDQSPPLKNPPLCLSLL